ncbi:MAG: PAS domain-containing protein [Gemmatimonadetes bacterium]|nr:PAS domain-containing protein [Gemmatimonadota bacterium]
MRRRIPIRVLFLATGLGSALLALFTGSLLALLGAFFIAVTLATPLVGSLRRLQRQLAQQDEAAPVPAGSSIAEVHALAGTVFGLTERLRQRLETAVRESREAAWLAEAAGDGILQLDSSGRVVRLNPAARMLLDLPASAEGRPVSAFIRHAELRPLLERAARGATVAPAEFSLGERRLLVAARPAAEAQGGAILVLVDLTEIRRLEDVRRDFVANASHELKTPLTAIRGYTDTLLSDELPPELGRRFLETIQRNAERLQRIVDDLLDLSRLESGGWQPELRPLDPLEAAREAWSAFDERARAARVGLVLQDAPPLSVRADASALRQIFSNLFDNALRHTPPGGQITVQVEPAGAGPVDPGGGPECVITVSDTGSGIPGDALPRIFERFYRVDPARSRAEGGTGLGLSIVRHLAERMGGDVAAQSELGKGTSIRIRLPAH